MKELLNNSIVETETYIDELIAGLKQCLDGDRKSCLSALKAFYGLIEFHQTRLEILKDILVKLEKNEKSK